MCKPPILLAISVFVLLLSCKKVTQEPVPVVRTQLVGNLGLPAGVHTTDETLVVFFDATHGVAGDYNFFRVTHNGGASWSDPIGLASGQKCVGLSITGETCFAFFLDAAYNGTIYSSSDNGFTWQFISNASFEKGGMFVSASTGYTMATSVFDSKLKRTTDGGLTWSNVSLPNFYSDLAYFYFFDENNGFVFDEETNLVYTTSDGGSSWTPATGGSRAADLARAGNRTVLVHGINAISYGPMITYSDNSGGAWMPAAITGGRTDSEYYAIHTVAFSPDGTIGCAFSKFMLYLSVDGGKNWVLRYNEDGTTNYKAHLRICEILPGSRILAFGYSGEVNEIIWR